MKIGKDPEISTVKFLNFLCTICIILIFSYCYEDEDGIHPEVSISLFDFLLYNRLNFQGEFLYDLQLPITFKPDNSDKEMEEFYLWTIPEVIIYIYILKLNFFFF